MSNNKRIRIGSRVSTEAWRFDPTKVDSDRWSFKNFCEGWRDARLFGLVMEKIGQKWKVKWDFDGEISVFETDILFKESDNAKPGEFLLSRIMYII